MKYKNKTIAKTGVAFALATSMLANTMEGIFAESENNVQEDTSKELSVKDEEIVEEVNVEAVEREKEVEAFLQTAPVVETEEKEASLVEEKQSASYVLSWAKFRNEYEKLMSIQGSTVTFTNQPVPAGTTTKDLTDTNDRSVVSYRVGNDLIVTTNGVDQKIKFPARSDYLFANTGNIFTTDNEVTAIDLSNVDTSDVVSFREMFSGCEKVVNLDLSNFDTSKATTMYRMFFYSRSLVNVDLTSFDTSNVTNMNGMFENCDALEIADVSRFNTEKVTDMWRMFYDCEKLTTIDTSNFKVPNLEYMSGMFSGCKSVTKLDLSGFNTEKVTNMDSLFNYCESLVSLDLSHFNTDNVDNMQSMFYDCKTLTNLDLSNFNTSNVEYMFGMFSGCTSLISLDVSSFDTSKAKDMRCMFQNCRSLQSLDISSFSTEKATDLHNMFYYCTSLKQLDVSGFDTSKVQDMSLMFYNCNSLESLDLSNFDTSQVKDMNNMFAYCSSLSTLYLNNFTTANVTNMEKMFKNCTQLNKVYAGVWDVNNVTKDNEMFLECKNLVGYAEDGTQVPYDANRVGKEMATAEGGYFTFPKLDEWTATVNYVNQANQVVGTQNFKVAKQQPVITAEEIKRFIPNGYEAVNEITPFTATQDNEVFEVAVKEVEWALTVEFVTADSRGVVESVTFNVSSLNPVIQAQQIIDAIPAGYYAVNEIQDLRATKDGEVFQIAVQKIEYREGIVHFVDQNGVTVKTQVYTVSDIDPIIRVEELEKALPVGAVLVNPLTELTVTKDKEEFTVQVIMPVNQEPNQPEIGGNDDTITDVKQPEGSIEGVQTGDNTQMGLWSAIMAGSVGVLAYLKRKKKNIKI